MFLKAKEKLILQDYNTNRCIHFCNSNVVVYSVGILVFSCSFTCILTTIELARKPHSEPVIFEVTSYALNYIELYNHN